MTNVDRLLVFAGSDLLGDAASALTIVSSITVVSALILAWNRSAKRSMRRVRRDALRAAGASHVPWAENARRHVPQRVSDLRRNRDHNVGGELEWLARVVGGDPDKPLAQLVGPDQLRAVAECYQDYSARLDGRGLLGSATVPILDRDKRVSEGVADQLREELDADDLEPGLASPPERYEGPDGDVLTWQCRVRPEERLVGFDLLVSHRRHRIIPNVQAAIKRAGDDRVTLDVLDTDEGERRRLTAYFSKQWFRFDAAMPRITKWAVQRDRSNGRPRLHLYLAECTFSTVLLDHYPPRESEEDGRTERIGRVGRLANGEIGMLTIALMVVTSDGDLVLASRSPHVAVGLDLLGPTVSGNLELNSRRRLTADFDAAGIPDPIGVAVREAREELGLNLDRGSVACVGLGTIHDAQERGTNVLLLTARVPETSSEFAARLMWADRLEGRWEVETVDALSLPTTPTDRARLIEWVLLTNELTASAKLAAIATLCDFSPKGVAIPSSLACELPDVGKWRRRLGAVGRPADDAERNPREQPR